MCNQNITFAKSFLTLGLTFALAACTDSPKTGDTTTERLGTKSPEVEAPLEKSVTVMAETIVSRSECALVDDDAKLQALVAVHRDRRFSVESMACAARAAMAYYDNNILSSDALNQAAETSANYVEHSHNVKLMDLMGANAANNRALEEAIGLERRVIDVLGKIPFANAEVKAWRGLMMLQLLQAEGGNDLDVAKEALGLIEAAVEDDEDVLNGLALSVLGRVYYEMPAVLGGDNLKSIALLERSLEVNPMLMPTLQYLAESYDQELEEQKAKDTLRLMLGVKPRTDTEQEVADGLRIGAGLARRLGDQALALELSEKREGVLAGNPQLLTRESESMGGHGGVNPLTGV